MKSKTTRGQRMPPKRPSFQAALALWISLSFVGWLLIVGLASVLAPADDRYWAIEDPPGVDVAPASGPD
ncbi:MAG: hypothetical protein H6907_22180 [Hyphomicrobiales bacterium]|nr:hypothetical protein [Hyphomicrobiales bacterium]